jgi:hypothetical protein
MQEYFGPVSGACQVSPRLRYAFSYGLSVEGHPGELGTTSMVSSCVCFRVLIGFAHLGFLVFIWTKPLHAEPLCKAF